MVCMQCGKEFKLKDKNKANICCGMECRILLNEYLFKEKFNTKFSGRFEYVGGYISSNEKFMYKCIQCGELKERTAQCVRANHKGIMCKKCNKIKQENKKTKKDCIKKEKQMQKEIDIKLKLKLKPELKALLNIANKHKYYNKCGECGRFYFSSKEKQTCSLKCCNKRSNRLKEIKRRNKFKENGKINWDISLFKLCERDKRMCYLCNKEVNLKDYITTSDGTFIAGNDYPSIDHIFPVSKGGTHTWNNIRLAHRYCNSIKSDKTTKIENNGQLRLII